MKTGLVMEGGAMRGMFTCGVIDVFLENNITFDAAIGVSAGAVFGCNYKSKQIGRPIRYNKRFCKDKRYCSVWSVIHTGDLYGADFCYNLLPNELDVWDEKTYKENPMSFYVVATDVKTGNAVYKLVNNGDAYDIKWMRASASMPVVSKPVEIDGRAYLDGGIADSVPIEYFEKIGYDRNVIILTQPKGFVKEKNAFSGNMGKALLKKYPKIWETLAKRHLIYNETTKYIEEREAAGEVLVIRPPEKLNIGSTSHDPEELERVYQIGRSIGLINLNKVKAFLNPDNTGEKTE